MAPQPNDDGPQGLVCLPQTQTVPYSCLFAHRQQINGMTVPGVNSSSASFTGGNRCPSLTSSIQCFQVRHAAGGLAPADSLFDNADGYGLHDPGEVVNGDGFVTSVWDQLINPGLFPYPCAYRKQYLSARYALRRLINHALRADRADMNSPDGNHFAFVIMLSIRPSSRVRTTSRKQQYR